MQYSYEEFVEILKSRKIVIYGAGSMAGRFYGILCKRQLEGNVICCAVTVLKEHSGEDEFLQGLEVIALKDAICRYPDAFFCVAVHESNRNEMVHMLQMEGIEDKDYIWPVPYNCELMLSKPIKEKIYISPGEIVRSCDDLSVAFRWLAIKQYYGLIDNGYGLYLRSLMIYSNQKTAEKRLESFKSLLSNWDKNGYDKEFGCKVDEELHILDGRHRLCAALWHKEKYLLCDMYRYDETYEDLEGPFVQDAATLEKNGFSRQEIELAEKTIAEMKHSLI
ncbi:MAG: hypothetical protein K2J60_19075 [Acetatifactor sp.]|nr:hypothetical protein [Acetatifactor sp.]